MKKSWEFEKNVWVEKNEFLNRTVGIVVRRTKHLNYESASITPLPQSDVPKKEGIPI
ncbi:MAG: hypothetical protein GY820_33325 [Gammaproteobacteria bacterium]|nr:hypothetical protein [Gammaproteobacteria bacterium]